MVANRPWPRTWVVAVLRHHPSSFFQEKKFDGQVCGLNALASSFVHGCYFIADKVARACARARFFRVPFISLPVSPLSSCLPTSCLPSLLIARAYAVALSLPPSLPLCLTISLYLTPSTRVSCRVGRSRDGGLGGAGVWVGGGVCGRGGGVCVRAIGGRGMGWGIAILCFCRHTKIT